MTDQQKTDQKNSAAPAELSQQGVERIRDIVFGPYMRDYDQRFEQIKRDFERLQTELDRLSEQLVEQDGRQLKKMQAIHRDMRQADDEIRDELRHTAQRLTSDKVDRSALGQLFIELGNQLKSGGSLTDLLGLLGENTK